MVNRFALIMNSPQPGRAVRLPTAFAPLWSRIAPVKTAALTGVASPFGRATGHFIYFHHDADQPERQPGSRLIKGIIRAGRKASRLGARVIGLGPPLSAALNRSAVMIARRLGLTVTGGSGYAAAAAIEALRKAAALMGLNLEESAVLILDAAEPLGIVCTRMLACDGVNYLTLVDRDSARLALLARRVLYDCGVACKISMQPSRAVGRSDLVVVAGKAAGGELRPLDLKPGAVVCNLGGVDGLSLDIVNGRPDVMAFDEAVVRLPGEAVLGCDLGLPEASVYAWMAEAILLALENRYDRYFLGREMHVRKVMEIGMLSRKHGFTLSGFAAANRYLDFAGVEGIKKNK